MTVVAHESGPRSPRIDGLKHYHGPGAPEAKLETVISGVAAENRREERVFPKGGERATLGSRLRLVYLR